MFDLMHEEYSRDSAIFNAVLGKYTHRIVYTNRYSITLLWVKTNYARVKITS